MQLVGPLVRALVEGGVEVGAVFAAEAQGEAPALSVELGGPGKPHASSIVVLGAGVNLLCWTET